MVDSFVEEEIAPLLVRAKRSILKKHKPQVFLVTNEIDDGDDEANAIESTVSFLEFLKYVKCIWLASYRRRIYMYIL